MSAVATLVATLRTAGVRFALVDGRLQVDAPGGLLTDVDKNALRQHRDELVALFAAEAARPPAPADPCLGCGTNAWTWTSDWPTPGEGRWLCRTCMQGDQRSESERLRAAHDALTEEERAELEQEAAAGDPLARLVVETLTEGTPVPSLAAGDIVTTIAQALAADGWIVVYSTILGAEVVFTRDTDVPVPDEYAALLRFDREELAVLAEQRPSADRLRTICDVKRELGGRLVHDTGKSLTPAREVFPAATAESAKTEVEAQVELNMDAARTRALGQRGRRGDGDG